LDASQNYGEMEDYLVIIKPKEVTGVTELEDMTLQCPIPFEDLVLPTTTTVTYDDETTEEIPVSWDESDYENTFGNYTLIGVFDLPAYASNTLGLTASILVIVEDTIDPEISCLPDQPVAT